MPRGCAEITEQNQNANGGIPFEPSTSSFEIAGEARREPATFTVSRTGVVKGNAEAKDWTEKLFRDAGVDPKVAFHAGGAFKDFPLLRPKTTVACKVERSKDAKGKDCLIINIGAGIPVRAGKSTPTDQARTDAAPSTQEPPKHA